ncbi:hypothetical protein [Candidatus Poriferisodalis sp.]|uniref:hypothetical protein n=1 Tax=Candidatus Poriferisodalis sp. TaxID=3101277 RepID=UPI003B01B221
MTELAEVDDLSEEARRIVREALQRSILESEDELDWLPDDFADRIIGLAWQHQFDIDKAAFRRQFRAYIRTVAEAVES